MNKFEVYIIEEKSNRLKEIFMLMKLKYRFNVSNQLSRFLQIMPKNKSIVKINEVCIIKETSEGKGVYMQLPSSPLGIYPINGAPDNYKVYVNSINADGTMDSEFFSYPDDFPEVKNRFQTSERTK